MITRLYKFYLSTAFSILALGFGLQGLGVTSANADTSTTASTVTFSQINQSIFQTSCVSCHMGSAAPAGIDLSTYDGVAAQVVAGSPSTSKLYQEISDGKMPPTGALQQDQIQQLNEWITAGAKND